MSTKIKKVSIRKTVTYDRDEAPNIQIERLNMPDDAEGENIFLIEVIETAGGKTEERCIDSDPMKQALYRDIIEGHEVDTG
jgi:hypothetical protein